ncbi:WhiB family transcriptional regulator [Streptomyces iconiensis]|uniref:WhiB family transcriptional regulator n=1 Tax=Streptomyces iconiensis TaxID=1384038 RepID=A0ABT6ZTR3_9ACTN|nr:WhiB family transcriptional regulator [Streptomyces iconiensis]MDJ1132454.1 WhiB family transcriptional regulator [Streptomyces iconiensis]
MTRAELADHTRSLYRAGLHDHEIAARLGTSQRTVLRLRHTPPPTSEVAMHIEKPRAASGWHRHSACTRPTPVVADWSGDGDTTESIAAQNICHLRCPVRALCLAEAMHVEGAARTRDRGSIAGGLNPQQRNALYRTLRDRQHRAADDPGARGQAAA